MGHSRRRLAAGLAALTLPVILGGAGRWLSIRATEQALADRGVRWETATHGLVQSRFTDLERGPVRAALATVQLLPSPTVRVAGVQVQLQGASGADASGATPPRPVATRLAALPVPVAVEDLSLRWGERVLADGLAGTLAPTLSITGEGVALSREGDLWQARISRPLAVDVASGRLELTVETRGEVLDWTAVVPDLVVVHPLLAGKALPPAAVSLAGTWRPTDGQLDARGQVGDLDLLLSGVAQPSPRSAALSLEIDGTLPALLALFGARVPEAARADCAGDVGLSVTLSLPDRRWTARPRAKGLSCTGVLGDVHALQDGAVTWRSTDADGVPAVRRTGPGQPGWTSWQEGRRLADAIMASEDIGFPTHPGYDLGAIQEALDEAAGGDPRPRGGSTLTQQLAKNLYLSGERTVARKLRELIYALALEQALDKRHILQLYLNVVELGPGVYGVGPAADRYFAKRPAGLTDAEAAFLATLLPSPVRGHDRAVAGRLPQARIDAILDNMALAGMRTPAEVEAARASRVIVLPPPG